MPVTPFHGGVGLLAKGCGGQRFSFLAFCATQVALDLESGYYLLRDEWPFHRFLHTFAGAILVCGAVVVACRRVGARWAARSEPAGTLIRFARDDLTSLRSTVAAVVTTAIGVLGHLIPDGIMHADVRPFAPFTDENPLYGIVSLAVLHWSLIVGGAVGGMLVLARHLLEGRGRR